MDLLQKVDGNQSRAHEWKSQRSVIDGGNNLKMLNLKALIYGFGKIMLLINIEHALKHWQQGCTPRPAPPRKLPQGKNRGKHSYITKIFWESKTF